ncbi:CLUMA_CG013254, isoform A [Clunio marinus]|uniref:CLUMA_CG013254, isoform A n=1 Tax=Clunio marinus TaxID=568069 RepID=A0A1J1II77_9DIPT|nr:CLUMA_CG013254, isoform A [Clunio marinus]
MFKKMQNYFLPRMEYEEVTTNDTSENYNTIPTSQVYDNRTDVISQCNDESENETSIRMNAVNASREHFQLFKSEKFKAILAFLLLICSFILALVSLALTHDRLPDRKVYKPLPDIFLDNVENIDFFLNITEIQIMIIVNLCIVFIFFHKQRFVIAKRCFIILSILYFYRSITMYVTVLPISSNTYYCSPKSNATSNIDVAKRVISLLSGMGLSINNKQTFCDIPNRLKVLHIFAVINAISGITFLLIAHAHYTIDVIIAYYVTTRLFWTYHSLCQNSTNQLNRSYFNKEWWMILFNYFEKDSMRNYTNEFEVPWPMKLSYSSV